MIKIIPKVEAAEWVRSLHFTKPSMVLGMLLAGDRWSCVDKVALATIDSKIVGIATIAPNGEEMSGEPTIVAIYVLREHRGSRIGYQLLEAAVDYMLSKGLVPIHIDAFNSKILRMIDRLPFEKRQKLNVVDQSMDGAMDKMFEV